MFIYTFRLRRAGNLAAVFGSVKLLFEINDYESLPGNNRQASMSHIG